MGTWGGMGAKRRDIRGDEYHEGPGGTRWALRRVCRFSDPIPPPHG